MKKIKGNEEELYNAYYLIFKNFEKAKKMKYVGKPLSWALYQVWSFYNGIEEKKEEENECNKL